MIKKIKAKQYIEEIKPYKQGLSSVKKELIEVIKLSSNENALGSSSKAKEAYKKHSEDLSRYADGNCLELREAIGSKYKIDSQRIVCGSGSDEIISLLVQAFAGEGDEIIYSQYGFLMYPISAQKFGVKAIAAKEDSLKTNIDNILRLINNKTKMIFIANPNNPTGSYIGKDQIQKLIDKTPKDIVIVLDLAYNEFVNKKMADYVDVISLVNENDNVVMSRTFSKIYGLASLRLGWSYS
ncbi:aminotransferase class I/II-fold pyridoxal phosphate-dependent enzyme, partial [Rickettsiales bacterium]|nr:aminotransferase class I/II-fold pyridoxal phosphate-dependent enzyme [Rickettsiales bacterium]